MIRILIALLLLMPGLVKASVLPVEGSTINYRLAGFTASSLPQAQYYRLEIASGTHYADNEFEKRIIISYEDTSKKMIQLLPEFGKSYTWRISGMNKKRSKKIVATQLCHFSTGSVPEIDTTKNRLRILNAAVAHKDMLLVTDNMAVMYNALGDPIWYLPELKNATQKNMRYRDLKPTIDGTFTALCSDGIYEFDYDGNILWQGPLNKTPKTDGVEYYHHDFTKLPNGHYMVLTNELIKKKIPSDLSMFDDNKVGTKDSILNIVAGAIAEYDNDGNIVWQWRSSDKFTDEEYLSPKPGRGRLEPNMHMNGFWFDDKTKEIYVSFRNVNTVMKISYPSGKVICRYGFNKHLFKGQHTPLITTDGKLLLFNNNATLQQPGEVSYVARYTMQDCLLEKEWEFGCDIDTNAKVGTMVGGSVKELSNGDILVSVGNTGRFFIVSPQKKILWNTIAENRMDGNEYWVPSSEYRTSYLEMTQLPRFIFRNN